MGTAQVHQASFGEQKDGVPVGVQVLVYLGFDGNLLDTRQAVQLVHLDLVVKVADVADNRLVLHTSHVLGGNDCPGSPWR